MLTLAFDTATNVATSALVWDGVPRIETSCPPKSISSSRWTWET